MRQLTDKEIIKIEDYIWSKDYKNEYNQFYFYYDRESYSEHGYMVDNYYINFNKKNGIWWMGIINLYPNSKGNLKGLTYLFKYFIMKYKGLGVWRHKDNKAAEFLHNLALRRYKGKQYQQEDVNYIIFEEVEQWEGQQEILLEESPEV